MEKLKEHRQFRNQLIIVTIICLTIGTLMPIYELIAFGIIYGLLAVFNIITYNENKKDYESTKTSL
jgi:hypothetical protein